MNILVTGRTGYIAKSIDSKLNKEYNITLLGRQDLDLTNSQTVKEWFKDKNFDVVVHTAIAGGSSNLIKESLNVLDTNLKMFYNLYDNRHKFAKLISFGSGAEKTYPFSPYGMSKRIINDIIKHTPGFTNLRIYAVFDENELDRRFIKRNIKNYINKKPILIHKDRYMDFIFLEDLIDIMKYFMTNNTNISEIDCVYKEKVKLTDISRIINDLDNHAVDINIIEKGLDIDYTGHYSGFNFKNNLEVGIYKTYKKLIG